VWFVMENSYAKHRKEKNQKGAKGGGGENADTYSIENHTSCQGDCRKKSSRLT